MIAPPYSYLVIACCLVLLVLLGRRAASRLEKNRPDGKVSILLLLLGIVFVAMAPVPRILLLTGNLRGFVRERPLSEADIAALADPLGRFVASAMSATDFAIAACWEFHWILFGLVTIAIGVVPRRRGRFAAFGWTAGAGLALLGATATVAANASPDPDAHTGPCFASVLPPLEQIVRFVALGSWILVLLFVLALVLPPLLDLVERRGFAPYVAARHVRASKSGFLTVISVLSMAGVGVSSCALCGVTSIMGGFGHDLKTKILSNTAHVVVDTTRPGGFDNWEPKLEAVRSTVSDFGGAATPVVAGDAMSKSASNTAGAIVRGIDPETIGSVIGLRDIIEVGSFDYLTDPEQLVSLPSDTVVGCGPRGEPYYRGPNLEIDVDGDPAINRFLKARTKVHPGVILGRELAKSLHVGVGDEITLLSPIGELGPMGVLPRSRKFRVAAVFYSGMYEYDATHAYVLLPEAQSFFSLEGEITHIDIRVPEPEKVDAATRSIADVVNAAVAAEAEQKEADEAAGIGGGAGDEGGPDATSDKSPSRPELRVRDWKEMNRNLFSALQLERIATFVILSIAIMVASFCIICTLLLMVTEKGKEIAILKALGASDGAIMRIFMLEGIIIGAIGTVFGVLAALAAMTGLSWLGVRLDPDVYYIDRLPVNVNGDDYALVALAALVICTLATIYPARAASKLNPVDGLRYE